MSGHSYQVSKSFGALFVDGPVKTGSSTSVPIVTIPGAVSVSATATLTAAQALSGVVTVPSSAGAAVTLTLPTFTQLQSAIPNAQVGDSFLLTVVNLMTATYSVTVAADGTHGTLVGSGTILYGPTSGTFRVVITNVASPAYIVYRI